MNKKPNIIFWSRLFLIVCIALLPSLAQAEPHSSAGPITPYWQTISPINVPYSANDTVSLTSITLYERYQPFGSSSWSSWTSSVTISISSTTASGNFSFPSPQGEGRYEFYTIAVNYANNTESAPATADASAGYDATPPTGSVLINSDNQYTTTTSVTLQLSAFDNYTASRLAISNNNTFGFITSSYVTSKSWYLLPGDGTKTVYVQFGDPAGNWSNITSDTIILDTTPPTNGTVSINTGAAYTGSPSVYVSWSNATDLFSVVSTRLVNSGSTTYLWYPYALGGTSWSLTTGDGTKTVYAAFRDPAGNLSASSAAHIILDTTPPTGGYLSINTGATYTRSTMVSVYWGISDTNGVASTGLSNVDGGPYTWSEYSTRTGLWSLLDGDGVKFVYVVFKDYAGNVSIQTSRSIILDTTPPSNGTISINTGAPFTRYTSVYVSWSNATDLFGVASTGLSNSTSTSYYWYGYSLGGSSWSIATGDGTKTVYAVFKDNAGNVSLPTSTSIILDTTPPTNGTVSINTGAAYTGSPSVYVSWSNATDLFSVVSTRLVNSGSTTYLWYPYSLGGTSWSLTTGDGTKTVYASFRDPAGNLSASSAAHIILDTTPPTGGYLSINTGATYTRSTMVSVYWGISDTNGVASTGLSNVDGGPYTWSEYSTRTGLWSLLNGDGVKFVYVVFKDYAGNVSIQTSRSIILDTTPPSNGTLSINTGASFTRYTSVYVSWSNAMDVFGVASTGLSNSTSTSYYWYGYSLGGSSWSIATGDGTKTVYAVFKDNAGNVSLPTSTSIILDTTPPTNGTVSINTGAAYTGSPSVYVSWSNATDLFSVVSTRLVNSGSTTYLWYPYSLGGTSWSLTTGDGTKTVYAAFRDPAGNLSASTSVRIILDTTGPIGAIIINSGAIYTNSTVVSLTLYATDAFSGVTTMRFSTDSINWSPWEPFKTSRSKYLTYGDGTKYVYVQYQDKLGNISIAYSDSIILDMTAPIGSITINNGDVYTISTIVNLQLPAFDTFSGVSAMRFSNDSSTTWSYWEPYKPTRSKYLTPGAGLKTVSVQYRDTTGNISAPYSDSIILVSPLVKILPDIKLLNNHTLDSAFKLSDYISSGSWQILYVGNIAQVNLNLPTTIVDYLTPLSSTYGRDTVVYLGDGYTGYPSGLKYSTYLFSRLPDALVNNGFEALNCAIPLQSYVAKDTSSKYPTSYPYEIRYGSSIDTGKLSVTFNGDTMQINPSSALIAPAAIVVTATPGISRDWDKEIVHVYEASNSYGQFTVSSDTEHWSFTRYDLSTTAGTLSWVPDYAGQSGVVKVTQSPGEKGKLSQMFTVPTAGWYTVRAKVATDIVPSAKQQEVYLLLQEYSQNTVVISGARQAVIAGNGGLSSAGDWKELAISYYATGTILGVTLVGINPGDSGVTGSLYIDDMWVYPAEPQVKQCYGKTDIPLLNSSFDNNAFNWMIQTYADGSGAGTWSWVSTWAGHSGVLRGEQSGGQKARVTQLLSFPNTDKNADASLWVYSSASSTSRTQETRLYLFSYDSSNSLIIESGNAILQAGGWIPGVWHQLQVGYTPISQYNGVQLISINPIGNPTQSIYFDNVQVEQDQDLPYYWDDTLF